MLWAIAEKKPEKAAQHAMKAARWGRLLLKRQQR